MILNEFFNLPQVFEKDMTESVMSEIDAELRDIVAREDFDALYELFSANTPAGRYVQDMYNDVVIDAGLHPDDDFERIEQIVFDRLADDFGEPDMAEGAPISGNGGAVDNFKQQMANRTEVLYQQNLKNIQQGVEEGMFGSRPSSVLPVVDKINKVARELTPQNVDAGKQIIQSYTRDITRMLSPQSKAGVDVIEQGVAEGWKDKVAGVALAGSMALGAAGANARVMPGDDPNINRLTGKPITTQQATDNAPAKAEAPKGFSKEYLQKAADPNRFGRYMISVEKAQELLNNMQEGVAEAKDDYVPPKEANYDDKYQAMVRRVGEKARAQEKAKQQPPKAPVRENRLALLKQIIQS